MWTTFAATVGGSAAGLTGLTFIVVAFRFDVVAASQAYRNRAAKIAAAGSTNGMGFYAASSLLGLTWGV
ncbi:hypothetical protein LDL08_17700 [Nonomuraea glycinis]|uniref:Uncharacterized protein n=1 Tax=Nonomuraea glycinis TaxID=2047744 RepID=A0A918E481_9ACTN|nr:hypothetical protein [Nonomuraea glycinis]MCA2178030.1 hypothetical protein [Nonomuraea glycinis]GGP06229.1 hypothetical protein GCM10012278_28800 [Nonomuraea glycinis]